MLVGPSRLSGWQARSTRSSSAQRQAYLRMSPNLDQATPRLSALQSFGETLEALALRGTEQECRPLDVSPDDLHSGSR